jgi:hypothetical protein
MGHAHVIQVDREQGFLEGGADLRVTALHWSIETRGWKDIITEQRGEHHGMRLRSAQ